jgi:mRNA-degrading endonuclease RelE of RelBE toxin-antitoxin system
VISRAIIAERARRQLRRVPRHIVEKLMAWIEAVEEDGRKRLAGWPVSTMSR